MRASRSRSASFAVVTLGATASLIAAVMLFNFVIDPFQQYRLAGDGSRRFVHSLQRYISPGIAKNADYEMVIQGSSMMENFNNAEVSRRCGMKAVNLALSAAVGFEQRTILETAFHRRPVRHVILSLDYNSFSPPPDASSPDIPEPLPMYLYDRNPLNDVRYLANLSVAVRSQAHITHAKNEVYSTNADQPWAWYQGAIFSREQTVAGLDPDNINKRFRQPQRTLDGMKANFNKNIAALIEKHPETKFDVFYPPYSILVWADFVQRDQLRVSLDFKSHVFERIGKLANVRIFDMQWDESITHNLDLYKDIYHHSPAQNSRMIAAACEGDNRYLVSRNSLPVFINRLREQAIRVKPREWIPVAR